MRCVPRSRDAASTFTRTTRETVERLATERLGAAGRSPNETCCSSTNPRRTCRDLRLQGQRRLPRGSRLLELRRQIEEHGAEVTAAEGSLARATTRVSDAKSAVSTASDTASAAEANLVDAHQQLDIAASAADADSVASGNSRNGRRVRRRRRCRASVERAHRSTPAVDQGRTRSTPSTRSGVAAARSARGCSRRQRDRTRHADRRHPAGERKHARRCGRDVRQRCADMGTVVSTDLDGSPPRRPPRRPLHAQRRRCRCCRASRRHQSGARTTRQRLRHEQRRLDTAMTDLESERERFASGSLVEPVTPLWRTDRSGQAGAALWRTVDIDPSVVSSELDGIEAALTASGLIDAWIRPDGASTSIGPTCISSPTPLAARPCVRSSYR